MPPPFPPFPPLFPPPPGPFRHAGDDHRFPAFPVPQVPAAPTPPLLTEEQRALIRHHMGYLNIFSGTALGLGIPIAIQPLFVLERAMDELLPEALPLALRYLARCEATEAQMFENQDSLVAERVGNIGLSGKVMMRLRIQYQYWRGSLAGIFAVRPNPFDMRMQMADRANIPVMNG
jgi:hypothetical protein